jgi:predicted dithiol-disulfide oxidoreductase (DUF899 family)
MGDRAQADAGEGKGPDRARDALAAERRRMPWMAVEKAYKFEGPQGNVSLLDLFEGRRQLIVYRAFSSLEYLADPSTPSAAAPWSLIRPPTWRI